MAIKTEGTPLKTILTISMGFLLIFIAKHYKWALTVSMLMGLVGIFSPYLSKKVDFVWMKLAYYMGMVSRTILLSVIFYVFLLPISLLSKVFAKKDPLLRKNNLSSTYMVVDKNFEPAIFEKTW
jgi:hypothetical protein